MNHLYFSCRWQKGISRYYKVILQKDLLGDWSLTKIWGGVNSKLGGYSNHTFFDRDEALKMVEEIKKHRKQRGYQLK